MPVNRTLNIAVTFACTHRQTDGGYGGGATYTQTGSTPAVDSIVDADGTIHLDNWTNFDRAAYNDNVDVEFTLATPCNVTPDNTQLPVAWATQHGAGMTVTVPAGGKLDEMEVVTDPSNPNVITLKDKDDDSNTYNYKPAVELTSLNHYYISLDPRIVNRP
ncbi:MAG: hypothetical protein WBN65_06135 [Gammaproteobacteria bacterium]